MAKRKLDDTDHAIREEASPANGAVAAQPTSPESKRLKASDVEATIANTGPVTVVHQHNYNGQFNYHGAVIHPPTAVPPAAAQPQEDWPAVIATFDEPTLRSTLNAIACNQQIPPTQIISDASVARSQVERGHQDQRNRQTLTVQQVSNMAIRAMYTLPGQDEAALHDVRNAVEDIDTAIESIKEAVKFDSSFKTKYHALEALWAIARCFVDGYEDVALPIRDYFQLDIRLEAAMLCVVQLMTQHEVDAFLEVPGHDGFRMHSMYVLEMDARDLSVLNGLVDVIPALCGGGSKRDESSDGLTKQERECREFEDSRKIAFYLVNDDVDDMLNETFDTKSQAYEAAYDYSDAVRVAIEDIVHVVRPGSLYETKRNALEALFHVGLSVNDARSLIAHEVREHLERDSYLTDAMMSVVQAMDNEEREEFMSIGDSATTMGSMRAMSMLVFCMFDGLKDVVDELEGNVDDDTELGYRYEPPSSDVDNQEEVQTKEEDESDEEEVDE